MIVSIDNRQFELAPGMTARHLVLACYGCEPDGIELVDRWGNRVGLDGALLEGAQLFSSAERLSDEH